MIFVCVGSRKSQFNRLIKEVDKLVGSGLINQEVIAQIGASDYIPKNIKYFEFLSTKKFEYYQDKANLIISHAGTGALISSLKKEKKVIAVPRLYKFGEHIDDHQTQVAEVLDREGYLTSVLNIKDLKEKIDEISNSNITKKYNKPSKVLNIIEDFIDNDIFL